MPTINPFAILSTTRLSFKKICFIYYFIYIFFYQALGTKEGNNHQLSVVQSLERIIIYDLLVRVGLGEAGAIKVRVPATSKRK